MINILFLGCLKKSLALASWSRVLWSCTRRTRYVPVSSEVIWPLALPLHPISHMMSLCIHISYSSHSQPPPTPNPIFIEKLHLVLENEKWERLGIRLRYLLLSVSTPPPHSQPHFWNVVMFTCSSTVAMVMLNRQFSVTSQGLQSPLVKVEKKNENKIKQKTTMIY